MPRDDDTITHVRPSSGPDVVDGKYIGRHGKPFTAWKFRSMRINGEQVLADV